MSAVSRIYCLIGESEQHRSGSALSLLKSTDEITGNRPFIIRWGWTTGGGHFVIGHGVDGNTMYYMNPWPGEGLKIADYNWVVSDGSHTWTHSQTTVPPAYSINASVQAGSGSVVCDTPVSRGANSVCGITASMGYLLYSFADDGFDKLSSVTNNSYVITNVIANHIITASFSNAPRAKVGANVFTSLQLAYNDGATNTGSEIKLLEGSLVGGFIADREITVELAGGYDAKFSHCTISLSSFSHQ